MGLLLSRRRTPSRPGDPIKVLVGAKRIWAFAGRTNARASETAGRLFQLVNVLYCQVPCAEVAALLTIATPPMVRLELLLSADAGGSE